LFCDAKVLDGGLLVVTDQREDGEIKGRFEKSGNGKTKNQFHTRLFNFATGNLQLFSVLVSKHKKSQPCQNKATAMTVIVMI